MAGNIFGGGMFGKPLQVRGQSQQGAAVPMAGQPQFVRPFGVVAPQPASPAAAPAQFQNQPLIPPTRVPMGDKKDCPICRG
jgi:hypothetical protein